MDKIKKDGSYDNFGETSYPQEKYYHNQYIIFLDNSFKKYNAYDLLKIVVHVFILYLLFMFRIIN